MTVFKYSAITLKYRYTWLVFVQRISVIAFGLRVTILIYIISPLNSYIHNVLSLKTSHGSLLFQEINKWHPNLHTTYKISDFLAFSLQYKTKTRWCFQKRIKLLATYSKRIYTGINFSGYLNWSTHMLTVTATDFHDLHKSLLILTPSELHGGLIFVGW